MAEILIFNNRMNFFPIFKDVEYSFDEFNFYAASDLFRKNKELMDGAYVYVDKVVKGFVSVVDGEIKKLYVDTFFQNEGIGQKLLTFAEEKLYAKQVWTLEKNTGAVRFYERQGFLRNGEKVFEEDTTEYLVKLVKK